MIQNHYGEFAALLVAIFWSITALSFEAAAKRVGSLSVNIIRLAMGFIFIVIMNFIGRGLALPVDASLHNWIWLSLSGIIGFGIGDFLLFLSFTLIGSWLAMLIMTLAPPMAAVFGWLLLNERLQLLSLIGIGVTLAGIIVAILRPESASGKIALSKPILGLAAALGSSLCQALGIVISKYGMREYSPFAATQIRITAGLVGFMLVITLTDKWLPVRHTLSDRRVMLPITVGSFFGPFLGVSFSLVAIQYTSTGIASTIMALVPIFIIPFNAFFYKHKITAREIIGTVISICGTALFFL